jgi:hypothetical protein
MPYAYREAYLAVAVEDFRSDFAAIGYLLKTVERFPFKRRKN